MQYDSVFAPASGSAAKGSSSMWPLLIASLGSSFLSGLFSDKGQKRKSFQGVSGADPRQTLPDLYAAIRSLGGDLTSRMNEGYDFSGGYAPEVPGMGLDMGSMLSSRSPMLPPGTAPGQQPTTPRLRSPFAQRSGAFGESGQAPKTPVRKKAPGAR